MGRDEGVSARSVRLQNDGAVFDHELPFGSAFRDQQQRSARRGGSFSGCVPAQIYASSSKIALLCLRGDRMPRHLSPYRRERSSPQDCHVPGPRRQKVILLGLNCRHSTLCLDRIAFAFGAWRPKDKRWALLSCGCSSDANGVAS